MTTLTTKSGKTIKFSVTEAGKINAEIAGKTFENVDIYMGVVIVDGNATTGVTLAKGIVATFADADLGILKDIQALADSKIKLDLAISDREKSLYDVIDHQAYMAKVMQSSIG